MEMGSRLSKGTRFSDIREKLEELVTDCQEYLEGALKDIATDSKVFQPPHPIRDVLPITDSQTLQSTTPQRAKVWAASQTLVFHRLCAQFPLLANGSAAILFTANGRIESA